MIIMLRGLNKVGVSAVVATVLIVMITVAAVGLLWAVVAPFLKNSVADRANCVDAEMSIEVDYASKYTCVSPLNGTSVRISRGGDDSARWVGIQIVYTLSTGDSTKVVYPFPPGINSDKVTVVSNLTDVVEISAVPVIKPVGQGDDIVCGKTVSPADIRSCSGAVAALMSGSPTQSDLDDRYLTLEEAQDLVNEGVDEDDFLGEEKDEEHPERTGEDCIDANVCLARGGGMGLYNSVSESQYDRSSNRVSPLGTTWGNQPCATETTFLRWYDDAGPREYGRNTSAMVGSNVCMNITATGELYDIVWLQWDGGRAIYSNEIGPGNFGYNRTKYPSGETVTFYSDKPVEQDCLSDNVCLARNARYVLYNTVQENDDNARSSAVPAASPKGTEWASGLCEDVLDMVLFDSFYHNLYNKLSPGVKSCLHLIEEDIFYNINWTYWGDYYHGGFNYTRELSGGPKALQSLGTSFVFRNTLVGGEEDCITDDVCITRDDEYPIYNSVDQSSTEMLDSPSGTEWAHGYCSEGNAFGTFMDVPCDGVCGESVPGNDFCLHLTGDDSYYDIGWISWGEGGDGGFVYIREEYVA